MLYVSSVVGVAHVSTDQTIYTVPEDVGQLEVWISITSRRIAPWRECEIAVVTTDVTAVGEYKSAV